MQIETSQLRIVAPRSQLNFLDIQSVTLAEPLSPIQTYGHLSGWMAQRFGWAFRVRDALSAPFGVRPIRGFSGRKPVAATEGERLDFFLVEKATPDVLVLTGRDRHLDVMTCIACSGRDVSITSSVVTHNAFGRLYMVVVGPMHRVIVRRSLAHMKDQANTRRT
ncbi:DUF2867 domain-containing protein [Mameliella sp. CS4]|uniref:DUF2867 domain-containing protein n=1 Tax=Mameliella sp. CS4 TaxID=2862329 RepID=UPI001C606149|nr:DUF2867 domain-containing protein [Mameliella sp. CS4]MBW4985800.1 DUF2867 domain-containing protein [Mameliella sp. CS4]